MAGAALGAAECWDGRDNHLFLLGTAAVVNYEQSHHSHQYLEGCGESLLGGEYSPPFLHHEESGGGGGDASVGLGVAMQDSCKSVLLQHGPSDGDGAVGAYGLA